MGQATVVWTNTSNSSGFPVEVLLAQGSSVGYIKSSVNLAYRKFSYYGDFTRSTSGSTDYEMGLLFRGNSTAGSGADFITLTWVEKTSTSVYLYATKYVNSVSSARGTKPK